MGSCVHLKTQGLMQGNGDTPAGWTVRSLTILHAHQKQGHGANFTCPVKHHSKNISSILYVDDTDILHMCNKESDMVFALQDSMSGWGNLLITTGGALKPPKCFYYLLSNSWDNRGQWAFMHSHTHPQLQISVPLLMAPPPQLHTFC